MPPVTGRKPHKFFRRATIWLPSWRLLVPLLLLLGFTFLLTGRSLHRFLAQNAPVTADVLVVEGWLPDYALAEAATEFNQGQYRFLVTSGGPMMKGSLVSGYDTYADLAEATLRKMDIDSARLIAAPAEKTFRNRTYVSAVSIRDLLTERSMDVAGVNIVSVGPHARRSFTVYRKVLGDQTTVGIIQVPPQDYDPDRWWASSDGLKRTVTEALGWLYETLFDSGR